MRRPLPPPPPPPPPPENRSEKLKPRRLRGSVLGCPDSEAAPRPAAVAAVPPGDAVLPDRRRGLPPKTPRVLKLEARCRCPAATVGRCFDGDRNRPAVDAVGAVAATGAAGDALATAPGGVLVPGDHGDGADDVEAGRGAGADSPGLTERVRAAEAVGLARAAPGPVDGGLPGGTVGVGAVPGWRPGVWAPGWLRGEMRSASVGTAKRPSPEPGWAADIATAG